MANDKDKIEDNNIDTKQSEDIKMTQVVDSLQEHYPNVPRGVIYEATVCIADEHFLANYLAEQQRLNTHVEGELTVGDLFFKNDPRELHSVIDLSAKIGLSKPVTILAAGVLASIKMLYNVVADDDIKRKLDDIDVNHSKKLIERANALSNASINQQSVGEDNKKQKKD